MSAAYAEGAALALPGVQSSHDRFRVTSLALEAMHGVRRNEIAEVATRLNSALCTCNRKILEQLLWGIRHEWPAWSRHHFPHMHWMQRSTLDGAGVWRLKMALCGLYVAARTHNSIEQPSAAPAAWLSWARCCRLELRQTLTTTLNERFAAETGMIDHRSNAFVHTMIRLLQRAKRAAGGFRTSQNCGSIAYRRMSKPRQLRARRFASAAAKRAFRVRCELTWSPVSTHHRLDRCYPRPASSD